MAHTSTSETHYSSQVTRVIDHAAQLTLEPQEETAAIINRLIMGIEMTPSENLAVWQRTESKLRRIFERHRRASDTPPSREAHIPPQPSHRARPTFQPTPMAWRQPTVRLLPPPSPTQSGGSSWYHQPHPPPAQLSVMVTTDTAPPPATQVTLAMPPPRNPIPARDIAVLLVVIEVLRRVVDREDRRMTRLEDGQTVSDVPLCDFLS